MKQTAANLREQLSGWTPGETACIDALDAGRAKALHHLVTSGPRRGDADTLRALEHWVYFREWMPPGVLGPDGHPASGNLLPPLTDRRRMFAGGRCSYLEPLTFGSVATATSSVTRHDIKHGRSGEFVLLTVQTRISQRGELCLVEEQDLMYRSGPASPPPRDPEGETTPKGVDVSGDAGSDDWRGFDEVTLFQFSALTMNSHRIHYDLTYARAVEGYPGLVVQGPLLVMCLAAMLDDQQTSSLSSLSFSLRQPVFAGDRVRCLPGRGDSATAAGRRASWDLVAETGGPRASLTVEVHTPAGADL